MKRILSLAFCLVLAGSAFLRAQEYPFQDTKLSEEERLDNAVSLMTVDEKILGKPKNREEAKEMLRELSGRTHRVITGLCIISSARTYTDVSVSEVTFASLSEEGTASERGSSK